MSLSLYPPSAFDVHNRLQLSFSPAIDAACQEIKRACKGLGTDEQALIKTLGTRSPNDRALIAYRYKELFHEELKSLLRSETGGDFGFVMQMLAMPLPEAEAFILHSATAGSGTTESLIYPIIMGRSNEEMLVLKKCYFEMYGKDLAVVLDAELSGDFKKVIMTALQSPVIAYNASFHTRAKAEEDADKLYNAGEGKWGTDEEGFLKVLLSSPPRHLAEMNDAYVRKHKSTLVAAVKNEFTGDAESALVYHVRAAIEPQPMLAEFFESKMRGMGTDEAGLSAAVLRYHPYLGMIAQAYQAMYKTSLKDRIAGEVSGDVKELLTKLLDAPTTAPASA